MVRLSSKERQKLKYLNLSDDEVDELILRKLKEINSILKEILRIFKEAGGVYE